MRVPGCPARALALAAILAVTLLAGCGKSGATHFYSFSSMEGAPSSQPPCLSLGVGPVEVPAYLDRRSVMVRESENRLALAEFEEWAEPVRDGLSRVLAQNLGVLVCAKPIAVHPWPAGVNPGYQVTVQVQRFDGAPGKEVALEATWSILDKEGGLLVWNRFSDRKPCGQGYAAMAAAMSGLVSGMSGDIARSLQSLKPQGGGGK